MEVFVVVENPDSYDGRSVEVTHVFRTEISARTYVERQMSAKPGKYKSDLSAERDGDDNVLIAGVAWETGGEMNYTVARLTLED